MSDLGGVPASSTIVLAFTTHAASGAAVAPSSAFEAADVQLYKSNSATQRASQAGWTMTSPFDSITGLHMLAIDLSDNTDAGFYAVGSFYTAVLSADTETVDALAVVRVIGTFRIVAAEGIVGKPKADIDGILGTAISTPATAGILDINVKNAANVAWASGAITAASIGADAITNAKIADDAIAVENIKDAAITAAKIATDAITAAKIAADAIGASELAADAVTEINAAIVALLPTALVSGRMDSSVGAMASGVLTATAIAADAITAAKIAADALGASELAADAATEIATAVWAAATRTLSALGFTLSATDLASDTITAAKVADGTIDAATFAAGAINAAAIATDAITAAKIAADAIGASELAADAVTEINAAVLALLPAALIGGRIDASVGAMAANVVTAASIAANAIGASELATDAVDEIVDAVWDEATSGHSIAGSTGKALTDAGGAGTPPTAVEVAAEVWGTVIEATETAIQQMRLIRAAAAGKLSGAATTNVKIRDKGDSLDRIDATVDSDGNRTAVTVNVS